MNCTHNQYTLDCAWCGYHKDPYRAFVDAVDRIQELESAIREFKDKVDDADAECGESESLFIEYVCDAIESLMSVLTEDKE